MSLCPPCQKLLEPFDLATFNEIHLLTRAQKLIFSRLIMLYTVRSEILRSFRITLETLPENQVWPIMATIALTTG